MTTTVHVVGNRRLPEVLTRLAAGGVSVVELPCDSVDQTRSSIRSAIADGAQRVVVVGGDGMVHTAVQELAGTDVVLGIVAHGTGNDFARALRLPLDNPVLGADAALRDPVAVDAIRSPLGWSASVVTAGFSGRVNGRANRMRFPKGSSKYTLATFAELPRLRADELTINVDGVTRSLRSTLIAIANTAYFGGGMQICPDAAANDGLLHVALLGPIGRVGLLRFLPSVFKGNHRTNPRCAFFSCRTISVEGDVALWADGESLGSAPGSFEVVPGALQIAGARL